MPFEFNKEMTHSSRLRKKHFEGSLGWQQLLLLAHFFKKQCKCFFFRWVNSESLPSISLFLLSPSDRGPSNLFLLSSQFLIPRFQYLLEHTASPSFFFYQGTRSQWLVPWQAPLDLPYFCWTFQGPFSMTIFLGHCTFFKVIFSLYLLKCFYPILHGSSTSFTRVSLQNNASFVLT